MPLPCLFVALSCLSFALHMSFLVFALALLCPASRLLFLSSSLTCLAFTPALPRALLSSCSFLSLLCFWPVFPFHCIWPFFNMLFSWLVFTFALSFLTYLWIFFSRIGTCVWRVTKFIHSQTLLEILQDTFIKIKKLKNRTHIQILQIS